MSMKHMKNTTRAGALLLAAALVTTVLTSGTLAKYTETVDGTDTARVSLFDFTAEQVEEGTQELTKTGSPIDIFGTSADDTGVYGKDDTNGEKLVAPGMEGYFQFKFTNKSEVAVKVDFDTLGYENANRLPLIYYFNGRYYSDLYDTQANRAYVYYFNEGDTAGVTLNGGMNDLSAAVNTYAIQAATTEPGGVERRASAFLNTRETSQNINENIAINWFWPYEVRDGERVVRMDVPDTAMGKDGTYTVTMTPVVRFTQTDTYQTPTTSAPGDQEWHPTQPEPGDEDITDPDNGPIAFKLTYYDWYNEKHAGEITLYLKDDSQYSILYSEYLPAYSVPGFSYRLAAGVDEGFTVETAGGAAVPVSKTVRVELFHEGYDHAIDTKAGLLRIADDMDGTFILAASVNTGNNNENDWTPIGWTDNDDVPFTGRINGNGKTISGLHATHGAGSTYVGFVAINKGTIQNLQLDFAQFEGGQYVGAVAGSNAEGAVIENVHVKGNAVSGISKSGSGDFAGGIAGQNRGTIRRCSSNIGTNTAQLVRGVVAYNYAGGIAGGNWGVVEECYALGGVNSGYRNAIDQGQLTTYYAGGLVGGNLGTIRNCYTDLRETVVGNQRVGGFVGWNGDSGSITSCYVAPNDRVYGGAVQTSISVGYNQGAVRDSYAVSTTSGTVNGFTRITAASLKSAASLPGFDTAVWDFSSDSGYPALIHNPQK